MGKVGGSRQLAWNKSLRGHSAVFCFSLHARPDAKAFGLVMGYVVNSKGLFFFANVD